MKHVLVVRLDSMGDMLAAGPAIRAVAAGSDRLTVLAGPPGEAAARLLPGVDDVIVWACPWITNPPPAVQPADVSAIIDRLRAAKIDEAVILTSFHQSALPTALLCRLADVQRITAVSDDYPGSLLDVRLPSPGDAPEPLRMVEVAAGAGFSLPDGDDGRLRVRRPLSAAALPFAETTRDGAGRGFVVVHPGASAPARAYPASRWKAVVAALRAAGWPVVVTGSVGERQLTADVAAGGEEALDLGGRLALAELADVLARAAVVVVANTGPAHLAAAVGTPVVSLFSPVVPAIRWAPFGVPVVLLGNQDAPCRGTRSQVCQIDGHPCLTSVTVGQIVAAVEQLANRNADGVAHPADLATVAG